MSVEPAEDFWSRTPELRIYQPIEDWSLQGRQKLVETHGSVIRWLLDEAFTVFMDKGSLSHFGFQSIESAVDWSLQRFAHGELDVSRLPLSARTFQLFTQVHFWLAQKVGMAGFRARIKRMQGFARSRRQEPAGLLETTLPSSRSPSLGNELEPGPVLDSFQRRLGATLAQLRTRTCAELVLWWLEGSVRMRQQWFGNQGEAWTNGTTDTLLPGLSKKQRSLLRHDALFRFACLWLKFIEGEAHTLEIAVAVATCFSPCENRPPYRVTEREVLPRLAAYTVSGARQVAQARRLGLKCLLQLSLRWLEGKSVESPGSTSSNTPPSEKRHPTRRITLDLSLSEHLEYSLIQGSLSPTLVHVYSLTDEPDLTSQLHALSNPRQGDER